LEQLSINGHTAEIEVSAWRERSEYQFARI
jgi:hypothetical protein